MAKGENENPDGGYDHFHEHGRRQPMGLAKGIPMKKAPDSGPHTLGKQGGAVGKKAPMKPMPTENMEGWEDV